MAIKVNNVNVIDDNRIFLPINSAEVSVAASITGGSLTLNLNSATVFNVTLDSSITSISIINTQSTGRASSFVLVMTATGSPVTVVWPASFRWPSGTAPTLTTTNSKRDIFTFFTTDGGTTWQAFITGQNT